MKLSAYQIDAEIEKLACVEVLEDGSYKVGDDDDAEIITEEEYHNRWEQLMLDKENKLNNIAELDSALDDDIDSLSAKIARLQKLKKQKENTKIRLREKVIPWLLHGEKYKTKEGHSYSYRKGSEVIIPDVKDLKNIPEEIAMQLPKECVKVTYGARVTEIKNSVKNGIDLSKILKVVDKVTTIIR